MVIKLTPRGRRWIEQQLLQEGDGTVSELVAAFLSTTKNPVLSVQDIQLELQPLDEDVVSGAVRILSQNAMVLTDG